MRVAIHPIFSVGPRDSVVTTRGEAVHLTRDRSKGTHLTGNWRLLRAWVLLRAGWRQA